MRWGFRGTRARRAMPTIAAVAVLCAVAAPSTGAEEVAVDLELVLAVDISGSVDGHEAQLQRRGYVQALSDPELVKVIESGVHGRIAVTYVEWAGSEYQSTIAGWTAIADAAGAEAFARRLADAPLASGPWTSISGAIGYVLPMFAANGYRGTRRAIDISGDGPNNSGILVTEARAAAIAEGVTINGLPILNDRPQPSGRAPMADLDLYYAGCVIGGPGAFMVVARGFEDFARAIRRKLIFEIAGAAPPEPAQPTATGSAVRPAAVDYAPGCDIGERQMRWRRRYLEDSY